MKHLLLFFLTALPVTMAYSADTLTLSLGDVLESYPQNEDGRWTQTYVNETFIQQGVFQFSHTGSLDAGMGMAYWDGFTLCTNSDTEDYGQGGSDGWVKHQWGCMAGGGLNSEGEAEYGAPYLVGYWGYSLEQTDNMYHSLRVDFTDGQAHKAVSVRICNHPWPYYGNIHGDGFAKGFKNEGDRFSLVAHGLNQYGEPTGTSVELTLAEFHDGALYQSDQWELFDLTPLGTVYGIYFTMHTTDENALYGANTAVYFCLDRLRVLAAGGEQGPERPTGLKATGTAETQIALTWNESADAESYILYADGQEAGTSTQNKFVFTGLQPYTEYALSVVAVAGGKQSDAATVTVRTTDETAPTAPAGLKAEPSLYSIALSWQPSTDNVGIKRYTIWVDGVKVRRLTATSYNVTGLDPATKYTIEVAAEDDSGNMSARAKIVVYTTGGATALQPVAGDRDIQAVYTVEGLYLGTTMPRAKGIYIIRQGDETRKMIIEQ